jgi:hypothetical protein
MNRRIPFAAGAAGAGLLAAAFLQAAVAAADSSDDAADISSNAFTIDGTTFDPGSDGYNGIDSLFTNAPLLDIGTTKPLGIIDLGSQDLTAYDSEGSELGTVTTSVNDANILGIDAAQFTVSSVDPADGVDSDDLPAEGTIYSITNIGFGFENIYEAVPNDDGDGAASISDTFVTPFGNFDIPTEFDAISQLDPGDAFDGLDTSGSDSGGFGDLLGGLGSSGGSDGAGGAGGDSTSASAAAAETDLPGGDNAVAINGLTFDPGSDGFDDVPQLFGVAPLMAIGGGALDGDPLYPTNDVEVYDGTGSDATDLGSVNLGVNTANILGIDSTQLTVTDVDPADGLSESDAADLPSEGTVYSVTNLGFGFGNVYEAVPNDDGSAAASISDTLVTPFGNFDVPTDFDAVADLDPGSPFEGLDTSSASSGGMLGDLGGLLDGSGSDSGLLSFAAGDDETGGGEEPGDGGGEEPGDGAGTDLSDHAFTIGDTSFDPGSDGFDSVTPLFGIAPLLEIGGAQVGDLLTLAEQDLDVYNADGDEVGSVETTVNTSNILGIETTQLTVTDVDPAEGMDDSAALPADGTVYSVTDLGFLDIHNVYEAVPADGDGAPTITDTLVTPFGNIDLSTPFNALADLDPGNAVAGVSDSGGSGGLFDGLLGGLLGGSGGEGSGEIDDASASQIASALGDFSGDDFSGDDSSIDDVASALAGGDGTDVLGDHVSGSDVTDALSDAGISIDNDEVSAGDIASALNDAGDSGTGGGLFDGLGDLFGGGDGAEGGFDLFDPSSWL